MPSFLSKLCPRAELAARVAALPQPVVFTNGVFDILHRGHVSYLAQARALGASLVLGLNSDASARRLGKGPDRPLNAETDRACVLAALESVSLVALFDEDTPVELLKLVRPQLYVKGATTTSKRSKKPAGCAAGAATRARSGLSMAFRPRPWCGAFGVECRREVHFARFTITIPIATAASAISKRGVTGSPSNQAPSSRPNTGVSNVNDASFVAW